MVNGLTAGRSLGDPRFDVLLALAETAMHVPRLVLSDASDRHPRLPPFWRCRLPRLQARR